MRRINKKLIFFSVVVPAYERPELLNRALNSVLDQDFLNYEIIVIDDCSVADLGVVVSKFKTNVIRYIKLEQNSGGGACRNIGIELAQGRYICFLDSDDVWTEKKLSTLNKYIIKNNFPNCIINGLKIKKNSLFFQAKLPNCIGAKDIFDQILLNNRIAQTSSLSVRSDIAKIVKFDDALRKHQDLDFYIRLGRHNCSVSYLDMPLGFWDVSHDQISVSRTSSTNTSCKWLISIMPFVGIKAYTRFSTKFIVARAESLSIAYAALILLSKNVGLCNRLKMYVGAFYWRTVVCIKRYIA